MASNVLILYGKYNKDDSRSTHCIKKTIPPQLKRKSLTHESVSKLFVLNFAYVSLTN